MAIPSLWLLTATSGLYAHGGPTLKPPSFDVLQNLRAPLGRVMRTFFSFAMSAPRMLMSSIRP